MSLADAPGAFKAGDCLGDVLAIVYREGSSAQRDELRTHLSELVLELAANQRRWHAGVSGLLLAADPILLDLGTLQRRRLCQALHGFLESDLARQTLTADLAYYAYQVVLTCGVPLDAAFWTNAPARFGSEMLPLAVAGAALHGCDAVVEFLTRVLPDEETALVVAALLPGLVDQLGPEGISRLAHLIAPALSSGALLDLHALLEDISPPLKDLTTVVPVPDAEVGAGSATVDALTRSLEALFSLADDPSTEESTWHQLASTAEAAASAIASLPPSSAVIDPSYRRLRSSTARLLAAVAETELPIAERAVVSLARGLPPAESLALLHWALATGRISMHRATRVLEAQGVCSVPAIDNRMEGATAPRDLLASLEALFFPRYEAKGDDVNALMVADAALPRTHDLVAARFLAM